MQKRKRRPHPTPHEPPKADTAQKARRLINLGLFGILILCVAAGLFGCGGSDPKTLLMEARFVPEAFEAGKGETRLEYKLSSAAPVSITIYDSAGRLVIRLLSGERETKGGCMCINGAALITKETPSRRAFTSRQSRPAMTKRK